MSTEPLIDGKRRMVIDLVQRRPACAIVQAGFGVSCNDLLAHFDTDSWVLHPTEGMRVILAPVEDFMRLAAECNERGQHEQA